VARIRTGAGGEGWSSLDRVLLQAADDLLADARIGDATYAALEAEMDTQQIMDVVFTVGAYEVFAMFLKTFDVELDADLGPYSG
jgi:alkylhydroperoxidase family enzyme